MSRDGVVGGDDMMGMWVMDARRYLMKMNACLYDKYLVGLGI